MSTSMVVYSRRKKFNLRANNHFKLYKAWAWIGFQSLAKPSASSEFDLEFHCWDWDSSGSFVLRVWNTLPDELRHSDISLIRFRGLLKQYYTNALNRLYISEDPKTWKSICLKCKGLFKRTQQCWPNIMQQFSNSVLCCFFCKYFNASSFNWNKFYRIIKTFEKQAVEPSVSSLLNNVGPTLLGPFEQALKQRVH